MNSITTLTTIEIPPAYIQVGLPALAAGLLLGALIVWLLARRKNQLKIQNKTLITQFT